MFTQRCLRSVPVVLALGLLVGCDKPNLSDDKGKYSYTIGVKFAENQKKNQIEFDTKSFCAGFTDATTGKQARMTPEDMDNSMRRLNEIMNEKYMKDAPRTMAEGNDYMEQYRKQEGVKATGSGLLYKTVRLGKGPKPKASDKVKVHYKGTLTNGKEFDSSYASGQPVTFPLGNVIPGWTEGVQLMPVGSVFEFVIPSQLAYGEQGKPPVIPPNSTLIFTIELLEIVK